RKVSRRQKWGPRSGRDARIAPVSISAARVQLMRPEWTTIEGPKTLDVNVVLVQEMKVPNDDVPIDWWLVTTEPIDCIDDLMLIVEAYRARWIIEEYFRALKQGCA